MIKYAGVGSRETPTEILDGFQDIASVLGKQVLGI